MSFAINAMTKEQMQEVVLTSAHECLQRVDLLYVRTIAVLIPIGNNLMRFNPDLFVGLISIVAELVNEDPKRLIEDAMALQEVLTRNLQALEAEKEQANV